MGRVSPFGNPRIKARSQLPTAYRSVPRPSSPLGAKASTRCPCQTLDRFSHFPSRHIQNARSRSRQTQSLTAPRRRLRTKPGRNHDSGQVTCLLSPAIQASNSRLSLKDTQTFAPTRRLTDSRVATNPRPSQHGRTRTPPKDQQGPNGETRISKTLSDKG